MSATLTPVQQQAFEVTLSLVRNGREFLFESPFADLPPSNSETIANDDRIPQTGFVGANYNERRILIVGINPGNGPRDGRSPSDAVMFPALYKFFEAPNYETYADAMAAQMRAFPSWLASKELGPVLDQESIALDDVAYINASPYRAGNGTAHDVFRTMWRKKRAATNWVSPMLSALQPEIVIAHGVEAARILQFANGAICPLTFNRVRIKTQRDAANSQFLADLRTKLRRS